jgi:tetratricopeptide (TPR) repeat protein
VNEQLGKVESRYRNPQFTEAVNIADDILRLDAKNLEARLLLGKVWLQLGMYPKALAQYQEELKISPGDAAALQVRDLAGPEWNRDRQGQSDRASSTRSL